MKFTPTPLPGLLIVEPRVFSDERGFFLEFYQQKVFAEAGITLSFVQDNHSASRRGVLRGMHFQVQHAQGKLVRVVAGEVFDAVVDIRPDSPTCGQWFGQVLSAENKKMMWVPPGFAHGFYTLSDWAEILYKSSDFYSPQHERTLLWNDPRVGIEWPLETDETPLLSPKDVKGLPLEAVLAEIRETA